MKRQLMVRSRLRCQPAHWHTRTFCKQTYQNTLFSVDQSVYLCIGNLLTPCTLGDMAVWFSCIIYKQIFDVDKMVTSYQNTAMPIEKDLLAGKETLLYVPFWCQQRSNHHLAIYLSMSPCGVNSR